MKLAEIKFASVGPGEFWDEHRPDSGIVVLPMHAEKYYLIKSQEGWETKLSGVDVFVADGVGLALGYRLLTGKSVNKCSGIDLINALIAKYPSVPTYIWGTTTENIQKAAAAYKERGLNVVGFHDGFSETPEEVIKDIEKSGAKLVLVGIGGKKQLVVTEINKRLGISAMTAGGSFDVAGGEFKRAPRFFQAAGLEWLWRMIIDPKRLKRLPALLGFVIIVLKEKVQG